MENALNLDTVKLAENKKEIVILDQTLLPNQCKYLNISTAGDIWEAIYSLRVRQELMHIMCSQIRLKQMTKRNL